MKEILVRGQVENDFKRLGINPSLEYEGKFRVYEVTDDEFKVLCDEPDIENTWRNGAWCYCVASNLGVPNKPINIKTNTDYLIGWQREDLGYKYDDLLDYIHEGIGATTIKNVCAVVTDLAKYNDMKISELFREYQD